MGAIGNGEDLPLGQKDPGDGGVGDVEAPPGVALEVQGHLQGGADHAPMGHQEVPAGWEGFEESLQAPG